MLLSARRGCAHESRKNNKGEGGMVQRNPHALAATTRLEPLGLDDYISQELPPEFL